MTGYFITVNPWCSTPPPQSKFFKLRLEIFRNFLLNIFWHGLFLEFLVKSQSTNKNCPHKVPTKRAHKNVPTKIFQQKKSSKNVPVFGETKNKKNLHDSSKRLVKKGSGSENIFNLRLLLWGVFLFTIEMFFLLNRKACFSKKLIPIPDTKLLARAPKKFAQSQNTAFFFVFPSFFAQSILLVFWIRNFFFLLFLDTTAFFFSVIKQKQT